MRNIFIGFILCLTAIAAAVAGGLVQGNKETASCFLAAFAFVGWIGLGKEANRADDLEEDFFEEKRRSREQSLARLRERVTSM